MLLIGILFLSVLRNEHDQEACCTHTVCSVHCVFKCEMPFINLFNIACLIYDLQVGFIQELSRWHEIAVASDGPVFRILSVVVIKERS